MGRLPPNHFHDKMEPVSQCSELTEMIHFDVPEIISGVKCKIPWHISLYWEIIIVNLTAWQPVTWRVERWRLHLVWLVTQDWEPAPSHHHTPNLRPAGARARVSIQTQSQHGAPLSHDRSEQKSGRSTESPPCWTEDERPKSSISVIYQNIFVQPWWVMKY